MGKKAKIATWSYVRRNPKATQEELIQYTVEKVDELANSSTDLICLPEEILICTGDNNNPNWKQNNLRMLEILQEKALAMKTNIAVNLEEPSSTYPEKSYNTAYLINRSGEVTGKYRKNYITHRARGGRGLAGSEVPVFDSDIGKIGFAICFDIAWRDMWQEMADKGAELVVWPSAYPGGNLLNAYAAYHMYHVVSSVWTGNSRIIDSMGNTVAESAAWDGLAMATVDLGMEILHTDFHVYERHCNVVSELRKDLGNKVDIKVYYDDNMITVSSNDPEWPMERIKKEYGLTSYKDYHAQAALENQKMREKYPE